MDPHIKSLGVITSAANLCFAEECAQGIEDAA